jgi:hypothetical protein
MSTNEPFGRQPKPVKVIFEGEPEDVNHFMHMLGSYIEHKTLHQVGWDRTSGHFTIYPRAVND